MELSTVVLVKHLEDVKAIQASYTEGSELWNLAEADRKRYAALYEARKAENGGEPDHTKWRWYV